MWSDNRINYQIDYDYLGVILYIALHCIIHLFKRPYSGKSCAYCSVQIIGEYTFLFQTSSSQCQHHPWLEPPPQARTSPPGKRGLKIVKINNLVSPLIGQYLGGLWSRVRRTCRRTTPPPPGAPCSAPRPGAPRSCKWLYRILTIWLVESVHVDLKPGFWLPDGTKVVWIWGR